MWDLPAIAVRPRWSSNHWTRRYCVRAMPGHRVWAQHQDDCVPGGEALASVPAPLSFWRSRAGNRELAGRLGHAAALDRGDKDIQLPELDAPADPGCVEHRRPFP